MVEKVNVRSTATLPIAGLLGVAFVVLKLTGYIDWSWWWVTAPFWGPFALVVAAFVVVGAVLLCIEFFRSRR